jgi:ribonuclease D
MCRPRFIAVDLEWSQAPKAPRVGMVQIATDEHVVLYRPLEGSSSPCLKQLLTDPDVVKFGVGTTGKVNEFYGVETDQNQRTSSG